MSRTEEQVKYLKKQLGVSSSAKILAALKHLDKFSMNKMARVEQVAKHVQQKPRPKQPVPYANQGRLAFNQIQQPEPGDNLNPNATPKPKPILNRYSAAARAQPQTTYTQQPRSEIQPTLMPVMDRAIDPTLDPNNRAYPTTLQSLTVARRPERLDPANLPNPDPKVLGQMVTEGMNQGWNYTPIGRGQLGFTNQAGKFSGAFAGRYINEPAALSQQKQDGNNPTGVYDATSFGMPLGQPMDTRLEGPVIGPEEHAELRRVRNKEAAIDSRLVNTTANKGPRLEQGETNKHWAYKKYDQQQKVEQEQYARQRNRQAPLPESELNATKTVEKIVKAGLAMS